jgi:hypothetical protein
VLYKIAKNAFGKCLYVNLIGAVVEWLANSDFLLWRAQLRFSARRLTILIMSAENIVTSPGFRDE